MKREQYTQLINGDGCEIILDAESSAGAFAVQEVIRELKVLCVTPIPRRPRFPPIQDPGATAFRAPVRASTTRS